MDPVFEISADNTRRVLNEAADRIDKVGWCRNRARVQATGEVCVWCALYDVVDEIYGQTGSNEPYVQRVSRLDRAFQALSDSVGRNAVEWNDLACESKEEAITALRDAATKVGS